MMKNAKQIVDAKPSGMHVVSPDVSAIAALALMAKEDVGALLVLDEGTLCGIVSERDFARRIALDKRSPERTIVRSIMTGEVITVRSDATVADCMAIMTSRRIRHLPVMNGRALYGIVSIGDLVKEVLLDQSKTIEELEAYIHG